MFSKTLIIEKGVRTFSCTCAGQPGATLCSSGVSQPRTREDLPPEPPYPAAELHHEVAERPAPPVARVEELALEQAEEPLDPGVVTARALARHAAGETVLAAQRHPAGPPVVATPVGVDHGRLAGRERRRGPGAHRPRDRPAAETVDRRAEVAPLAGRQPELGDAGHPQLVGAPGAEQVRPVRQQRQVGGARATPRRGSCSRPCAGASRGPAGPPRASDGGPPSPRRARRAA